MPGGFAIAFNKSSSRNHRGFQADTVPRQGASERGRSLPFMEMTMMTAMSMIIMIAAPSPVSRRGHDDTQLPSFGVALFRLFITGVMKRAGARAITCINRRCHYALFVSCAVVESLLGNPSALDE